MREDSEPNDIRAIDTVHDLSISARRCVNENSFNFRQKPFTIDLDLCAPINRGDGHFRRANGKKRTISSLSIYVHCQRGDKRLSKVVSLIRQRSCFGWEK